MERELVDLILDNAIEIAWHTVGLVARRELDSIELRKNIKLWAEEFENTPNEGDQTGDYIERIGEFTDQKMYEFTHK